MAYHESVESAGNQVSWRSRLCPAPPPFPSPSAPGGLSVDSPRKVESGDLCVDCAPPGSSPRSCRAWGSSTSMVEAANFLAEVPGGW